MIQDIPMRCRIKPLGVWICRQLRTVGCGMLPIAMVLMTLVACSDDGAIAEYLLETEVNPAVILTEQSASVSCTVTIDGSPSQTPTRLLVAPQAATTNNSVTPAAPGAYEVACALAEGDSRDITPSGLWVLGPNDTDRIRVETTLATSAIAISESAVVSCAVYYDDKLIDVPTAVTAEPPTGLMIDDWTLTGTVDAEYDVACIVRNTGFADTTPARLIVGTGNSKPAVVIAELAADEVVAGTSVGVLCRVQDDAGNPVEGEDTFVEAPLGVGLEGTTVVAQQAGEHDIFCRLSENNTSVAHIPGVLRVLPSEPVTVAAWVDPSKPAYKPGDIVTVDWTAKDAFGNDIVNSEATVAAPSTGVVSIGDASWELVADGERTFTVTLKDNVAFDDVTIVVDSQGPTIVITSPERGQMITEPQAVVVTGTVKDTFGIASVTINDEPITLGEGGEFTFEVDSVFGLNPILVEAYDANENRGVGSVSWYFSGAYQSADLESIAASRLDRALQIWLSQDVIDDFDHTEPEIDDLAHLLELLLTYADFADVLGKPVLFEQTFPNVVNESFGDSSNPIVVVGDLSIWIDISSVTAGNAGLNLLSRDGGIDVSAAFAPVTEGAVIQENGLTVQLSVNLKFDLSATTELIGLPVTVDLSPPPTAISTSSLAFEVLNLDTSFDIGMVDGALNVTGQQLVLSPEGISLSPLADVGIDLGSVTFTVAGFELLSFPLGTIDLTQLVSGLDSLFQGLLDPILNGVVPLLTEFLEPLIAFAGGEALESALQSIAIDQSIQLPEMLGQSMEELILSAAIGDVLVNSNGVAVGLNAAAVASKGVILEPPGSIRRDGCLDLNAIPYELPAIGGMEMALGTDLLNQLLYSLWYGGGLNIALSATELSGLTGNLPIESGTLSFQPLMPPIMSDCNGKSQLVVQIGDALLEADLQVSDISLKFKAWIAAEIGAAIGIENDELSFGLTGVSLFQLELFDVEGVFDGDELGLETLLQALISDVLIGQLAGETLGSFPIPSINLTGLAPDVPEGSVIELNGLSVKRVDGFFQLDGTLGPLAPDSIP